MAVRMSSVLSRPPKCSGLIWNGSAGTATETQRDTQADGGLANVRDGLLKIAGQSCYRSCVNGDLNAGGLEGRMRKAQSK
jgi:hypothetical protein